MRYLKQLVSVGVVSISGSSGRRSSYLINDQCQVGTGDNQSPVSIMAPTGANQAPTGAKAWPTNKKNRKNKKKEEREAADDGIVSLGAWVRWRVKDEDRQQENVAELETLIESHGIHAVQLAAHRVTLRTGEKAWPSQISDELIAAIKLVDPDSYQPVMLPEVLAIWTQEGWRGCCRLLGMPEEIGEERMRQKLTGETKLANTLVEVAHAS